MELLGYSFIHKIEDKKLKALVSIVKLMEKLTRKLYPKPDKVKVIREK